MIEALETNLMRFYNVFKIKIALKLLCVINKYKKSLDLFSKKISL